MAKKKKGRIAVPYIIALIIFLIIVGGAAYMLFDYFNLGKDSGLPELSQGNTENITYEDSHTVLLVLETPDEHRSVTFAVMRSVPKEKKLVFAGIPANTLGTFDGRDAALSKVYGKGGAGDAVEFLERILDVDIDRYIVFDKDSFNKICDMLGGVTYTPGVQISGLGDPDKAHYMVGSQIKKLITYPSFKDGEMQRAYNTGEVLAAMVNQTDYMRLSDNLDLYFDVIKEIPDTDITAADFKSKKNGVRYMFRKGRAVAEYAYVTGKSRGGYFVIDESFCRSFKKDYFVDFNSGERTDSNFIGPIKPNDLMLEYIASTVTFGPEKPNRYLWERASHNELMGPYLPNDEWNQAAEFETKQPETKKSENKENKNKKSENKESPTKGEKNNG